MKEAREGSKRCCRTCFRTAQRTTHDNVSGGGDAAVARAGVRRFRHQQRHQFVGQHRHDHKHQAQRAQGHDAAKGRDGRQVSEPAHR